MFLKVKTQNTSEVLKVDASDNEKIEPDPKKKFLYPHLSLLRKTSLDKCTKFLRDKEKLHFQAKTTRRFL